MSAFVRALCLALGLSLFAIDASAARTISYQYIPDIATKGFDCLAAAKAKIGPYVTNPVCDPDAAGVSDKIKACPSGQYCEIVVYLSGSGNGPYYTSVVVSGGCAAGASAGRFTAPGGYVRASDGEVVQNFPDPAPFGFRGCMVAPAGNYDCFSKPEDAEVAPGVKLAYCTQDYKETGATGGAASQPEQNVLPYDGSGDTGGGDTGGGDTGGGDTGGGDTGGGDTGGGDTGGGDTGGGDTGGGDTGGGDTGGGDGTGDLCTKHPGLNICKNSSWSGSCEQITCNGDAIQCEILRQAAAARCDYKEGLDALAKMKERLLGEQILAGNDPDKDKLPSKANGEQVGLPSFDTSGWLGGGSCFEDKSFTFHGQTFTLPFSLVCDYLVVFRYAFMVIAALISFKVLSGAILRD